MYGTVAMYTSVGTPLSLVTQLGVMVHGGVSAFSGSNVYFSGNTTFSGNSASCGGGVRATSSNVYIMGTPLSVVIQFWWRSDSVAMCTSVGTPHSLITQLVMMVEQSVYSVAMRTSVGMPGLAVI